MVGRRQCSQSGARVACLIAMLDGAPIENHHRMQVLPNAIAALIEHTLKVARRVNSLLVAWLLTEYADFADFRALILPVDVYHSTFTQILRVA